MQVDKLAGVALLTKAAHSTPPDKLTGIAGLTEAPHSTPPDKLAGVALLSKAPRSTKYKNYLAMYSTSKPGAKPGNTNAMRDTESATSFIHARCTPAHKAAWVKAAQAQNLKLTEWIVKTLNSGV